MYSKFGKIDNIISRPFFGIILKFCAKCYLCAEKYSKGEYILANKEDTDIIVLTGIGGIGKSILAAYLANKLYDESNYKYKWFDCKDDLNEKYRLILEKEFNQIENNKDYIINYLSNYLKDEKRYDSPPP